jgi:sortase (surface protein transpeptidase)
MLSDIGIGDRITVTSADGSSRVYCVTDRKVVDPHLAEQQPRNADDNAALVSCQQLDRALADSLGLAIQATRGEPLAAPRADPERKL